MVLGAGILFQIDLVPILVGIESLIIHTISDTESLDAGRVTVGNQRVSGRLLVLGGRQLFGFIRADSDDLIAQLDLKEWNCNAATQRRSLLRLSSLTRFL